MGKVSLRRDSPKERPKEGVACPDKEGEDVAQPWIALEEHLNSALLNHTSNDLHRTNNLHDRNWKKGRRKAAGLPLLQRPTISSLSKGIYSTSTIMDTQL